MFPLRKSFIQMIYSFYVIVCMDGSGVCSQGGEICITLS